ncbi:gamma-glutamylcyclotransferase family protein [Methylophaga thalassica]|uniref:gamma-glutamylcyclotransferase family protein n=1 Tax=Methylophaga aminisulfidivorans TaxID=230105 RepID=UPI003A8D23AE
MTEQNTYLFVYGTLMKDTNHSMARLLTKHSEFICRASMQGQLYLIDYYPGAILSESKDDIVYGELYKLSNASWVLSQLDDYEECSSSFPKPHEYQRQLITIQPHAADVSLSLAWAYLYQYPLNNKPRIKNGQFEVRYADTK